MVRRFECGYFDRGEGDKAVADFIVPLNLAEHVKPAARFQLQFISGIYEAEVLSIHQYEERGREKSFEKGMLFRADVRVL